MLNVYLESLLELAKEEGKLLHFEKPLYGLADSGGYWEWS